MTLLDRIRLVFLTFCFASFFSVAQNDHPDILRLENLQNSDLQDAKRLADSILTATSNNTTDYYHAVRINLGNTLRLLGQLDSAKMVINEVSHEKIKSKKLQVTQLVCKGDIADEMGEADQSIDFYLQALDIAEQHNLKKERGIVYNNMGATYLFREQYDKATVYFKQALVIQEELKDSMRISKTLNNLGASFRRLGDLDSARFYYEISVNLKAEMNDLRGLNSTYLNIAILDQIEGKRADAVAIYEKVTESSIEIKDYETAILSQINRGNAYIYMSNYAMAEESYFDALDLSENYEAETYLGNIYLGLAVVYEKMGNASKVLEYRKKYHAFYVDQFNLQMEKEVSLLETKFQTEKKDREIEKLRREQIETDLKSSQKALESNRTLFKSYLILTILALSLIFVLILFLRKRSFSRKQKVLLEEREVLLKEVHHRVKNNLQIVSSLLSIQGELGQEVDTNEILRQAKNRIQSIAIIHEKLYQSTSLADVRLDTYFSELFDHLNLSYNLESRGIKIKSRMEATPLDLDQIVPCGLIVNELITNAIKHAFENGGTISVTGKTEAGEIKIDIKDSGRGFPDSFELEKSHTLGLKLSRGLARQLKGALTLQNPENAHFRLTINQAK